MTATVVEPVVETSEPSDDPLDVTHVSCHCTDNKTAWCGADLSDIPVENEPFDPDEMDACIFCALVMDELDDKCCPWGCTCPGSCGPAVDDPEPIGIRGMRPGLIIVDEWLPNSVNRVLDD